MVHTIHCYAEGHPGSWEAFCLDFDVSVQGESFEDVYKSLNEGIVMYLEYVAELPEDERKAFMNRRAPLFLRWCFVWHSIRSLFINKTNAKERHEFTAPCPA